METIEALIQGDEAEEAKVREKRCAGCLPEVGWLCRCQAPSGP